MQEMRTQRPKNALEETLNENKRLIKEDPFLCSEDSNQLFYRCVFSNQWHVLCNFLVFFLFSCESVFERLAYVICGQFHDVRFIHKYKGSITGRRLQRRNYGNWRPWKGLKLHRRLNNWYPTKVRNRPSSSLCRVLQEVGDHASPHFPILFSS